MNKVLIACPTYDGMDYCFDEFVDRLRQIDYQNFKILIVDNSRTKKFFRKIRKVDYIKVIYDDTDSDKNMDRLISSRNKILDYAIEKNYDYVLMMDSDVMVKPDVLNRLLSFSEDVVSGLYYGSFKVGGELVERPVAFSSISQEEFDFLSSRGDLPKYAKTKDDVMRYLSKSQIENNDILEVKVPSGGCLLLSRAAFSSGARYGLEDFPEGVFVTDDIYFFNRLKERGFRLYCAPKVLCEHYSRGKYEGGIHPLSR